MRIAVIAQGPQQQAWLQAAAGSTANSRFYNNVEDIPAAMDAVFDLEFTPHPARIAALDALQCPAVFINSVTHTLQHIGKPFIRINAWPGFLQRTIQELAAGNGQQAAVATVMEVLQWNYKVVPDIIGLVTPRVIAMIVNEAYYALGEGVSTKQEIDIAMKLGTNYPKGPFEWAGEIGLGNIGQLLTALQAQDARYTLAPALAAEIQ